MRTDLSLVTVTQTAVRGAQRPLFADPEFQNEGQRVDVVPAPFQTLERFNVGKFNVK